MEGPCKVIQYNSEIINYIQACVWKKVRLTLTNSVYLVTLTSKQIHSVSVILKYCFLRVCLSTSF